MRLIRAFAWVPVALCACSRSGKVESAPPESIKTISLVATNDVHGRLERLPLLAGYVDILRKARKSDGGVLLLDAGDAFQGTIESNLNEGGAVVSAFNAMGYAALAIGNHEFDFGPAGPAPIPKSPADDPHGALKARMVEARFPFLSANLIEEKTGAPPAWPNLRTSMMITVAGVRVGVVGGMTEDAERVIKRANFAGLDVAPLAASVSREASRLRASGAEIVVAVAHAGGRCARYDDAHDLSSCEPDSEIFKMARAVPAGLVDVIVGGHRDQNVAHYVAGTPVVHAPSYLGAFSRVDILYDPVARRVVDRRIHPPEPVCKNSPKGNDSECVPGNYLGDKVVPGRAVTAAIAPAIRAAGELRAQRLGVRVDKVIHADKRTECPLGNLFVDLMRDAVPGADAAFSNGGSLRNDLPMGELTFGALHRAMPFDNQLVKLKLTGAELKALLRANVSQTDHGILSVSGIRARVACNGTAPEITLTREDGRPIEDEEELIVVTSDFVAMGGDGLLDAARVLPKDGDFDTGLSMRDVLVAGIKKSPGGSLAEDPGLFDPGNPRIDLPGPMPLACPLAEAPANADRPRPQ